MRLFVAVEIDPLVLVRIAECVRELRRRAEEQAPDARINWVPPERLHVTVRFIGDVEASRVADIEPAFETPLATPRFDLALAGIGTFPERGRPRVLWTGAAAGVEALGRVEREVSARLEMCGIALEGRPYRPHVTLARVREGGGLRPGPLLAGVRDRTFGSTPVDAITLFESRASAEGQTYVPLRRTRLRSA